MNRAQIGESELEYEVRGTGEPVVLVHGSHIYVVRGEYHDR
jgi:hypothetical protein